MQSFVEWPRDCFKTVPSDNVELSRINVHMQSKRLSQPEDAGLKKIVLKDQNLNKSKDQQY